jgi:prolyl-tRNA synthetase
MSKVKILKMMEKVGLPPFMDVKDISLITEVSVQTLYNWSKTDKESQLHYLLMGVKREIEMKKEKVVTYKKGIHDNNSNGEETP